MGEEGHQRVFLFVVFHHAVEIHIEHGVGDEHQEGLGAQFVPVSDQGAGVAQGCFFHNIVDFDAKVVSIAKICLDFFMHVGDSEQNIRETLLPEGNDFPLQDGL